MLTLRGRKARYVAVAALVVLSVLVFVSRHMSLSEFEVEIDSVLIDEKSGSSMSKSKTKPFLQTDAARKSEMQLNINKYDSLSPQQQFKLIGEILEPLDTHKFEFLSKIFQNIYRFKPHVPQLSTYKSDERIYHARYNSKDDDSEDNRIVFNEEYLSSFLQLSEHEFSDMKRSHSRVMRNLPKPSQVPKDMYNGDGIVFVGGGRFNFLTLLSIKAIRDLGSKLPVEILIPSLEEFESNLCFKVFPEYNAKCILLPHALRQQGEEENIFHKFEFKGYQYKVLALLLSSFERILFLDSDNTPTRNPDRLFNANPFSDHGLIVWPDFWKRATSPLYYKIAGIDVNKKEFLPRYNELISDYENIDYASYNQHEIPFHQYKGAIPDPTSESGQIMINKKTHLDVLVLALYYNLFGPTHYYPLFSQGSDGEGDKETFLASCVALGCKFYQVKKFLKAMGYFNSNMNFVGTGMGQFNPINDHSGLDPDLLFIHSNFPKLNPWDLRTHEKIFDNGERIRLYGNGVKKDIQFDFELHQWKNMFYFICEQNIRFATFRGIEHEDLCDEIKTHLQFLEETTHLTEDAF